MTNLMERVLAHPEVEISGDAQTEKLLQHIPQLLAKELELPLNIGNLMRSQHMLMLKLTENADSGDQSWYEPTIAQVAGWPWAEQFLAQTNRAVIQYLDWSYVPANHPLREGACTGTVGDLFQEHPACIIAPLLRTVRNVRH